MVTALGVAPDQQGNGLDALTHRRIIAAHWNNTGIVSGLNVSGAAVLHYQAQAGLAVCSQGWADGAVEAYWPGGLTVEGVSAGDSAYGRVDTIYLMAHTGSPDNQVSLHVAQGQPSANPMPAGIPSGALCLQRMYMPAGATSTWSASPWGGIDYAIPYGASLGQIGYAQRTDSGGPDWVSAEQHQLSLQTSWLPTDRLVDVKWTYRASTTQAGVGSHVVRLYVDDQLVSDALDECPVFDPWVRSSCSWRIALSGGRQHKVSVTAKPAVVRTRWMWQGFRSLTVSDVGVTQ